MMNDLAKAIRRWTEKNHDRRSSAFNVFVYRFLRAKSAATEEKKRKKFLFFDSNMAKQQLQKWELKFVTELEPLEGTSPVKSIWNLEKTSLLQFCVNFSNNVVSMAKPARY